MISPTLQKMDNKGHLKSGTFDDGHVRYSDPIFILNSVETVTIKAKNRAGMFSFGLTLIFHFWGGKQDRD